MCTNEWYGDTCVLMNGKHLADLVDDTCILMNGKHLKGLVDDTCVPMNVKHLEDLVTGMQKELNLLYIWLQAKKLSLNVQKTYYIIFHRAMV